MTQAREPWTETVEDFGVRLKGICQHINDNFDVEGLCEELPYRIQEIIEAEYSYGGFRFVGDRS